MGTSETLGGGPSGVVTGNTSGPKLTQESSSSFKFIETKDGKQIIVIDGMNSIRAGMIAAVMAVSTPDEDEMTEEEASDH